MKKSMRESLGSICMIEGFILAIIGAFILPPSETQPVKIEEDARSVVERAEWEVD